MIIGFLMQIQVYQMMQRLVSLYLKHNMGAAPMQGSRLVHMLSVTCVSNIIKKEAI